jgi:hypothetical protein
LAIKAALAIMEAEMKMRAISVGLDPSLPRSHKGPRVEQLIKAAGAELRYLPP